MCREETRYYLDGVYLHHVARVGALRFVATDGNRLTTADIGTAEGAETIRPVILSRPFVAEAFKGTSKRRDAFRQVRLAIFISVVLSNIATVLSLLLIIRWARVMAAAAGSERLQIGEVDAVP